MINIREEIIERLYEIMNNEKGVHDEVKNSSCRLEEITCKDIDEKSEEYDKVLDAICELGQVAFFAGASMVFDFISGQEKNEKVKKYDLCEISAEINAISMIVSGLANQIGEDRDSLQDEPFKSALFGVSRHLDRVVESLDEIEKV